MISKILVWLVAESRHLSHLLTWHAFGVLALLPGLIALLNQIPVARNFDKTKDEVRRITVSDERHRRRLSPVLTESDTELEHYRPRIIYTLLGALFLVAVFEVVAALGGPGKVIRYDFGVEAARQTGTDSKSDPRRTKGNQGGAADVPTAEDNAKGGTENPGKPGSTANRETSGDDSKSQPAVSGLSGLVYAGYGAYIYTMFLVISRLNSSALTGKFLAVSAVRSAIALVLGFTAAATNIFSGLSSNQALFVLFFIGLFPSWAMDAVRRKAQDIFKPTTAGCDVLPICLIDGLDDGIADRLAEIGVWDIQHIASADHAVLAAKTLYPIRRILDWMDQAILISYVRAQVTHFRAVGVRGAIDFAVLYRDAMSLEYDFEGISKGEDQQAYRKKLADRATEVIKALSQKTELSEASLNAIGRSLYEDPVVRFIWDLWFEPDGPKVGIKDEGGHEHPTPQPAADNEHPEHA
jgi:hypothetical protein